VLEVLERNFNEEVVEHGYRNTRLRGILFLENALASVVDVAAV